MKTKFLLFILISIGSIGMNIASAQNLNISFLLDLSDRIDPKKNPSTAMQYYQRDVQYIKSVEKAFINHVKQKKIIQLKDQMQVFFDPAPQNQ